MPDGVINNETHLLHSVLCYEEGHCRRTQHILKVECLKQMTERNCWNFV